MKRRFIKRHFGYTLCLISLIWTIAAGPVFGQGTAFSYQGRLTNAGNPADGLFDMQFRLFDTADVGTGSQQGSTITNPAVQVTNGVFTVQLDFGAGVFSGEARFLEIRVRASGSPDPHTILAPRQPLTSIPYAVRSTTATNADTATNAVNAMQLGGQPASGFIQNSTLQQAATNFNIGGNGTVGGTLTANTAIVNGNVGIGVASPTERLDVAGNGLFTGNLTASGSISVAGLRTHLNANSPNVIGGNSGNSVTAGVFGATIGGGGQATLLNRVTDNLGAIGGGRNNQAGDNAGTTSDRGFATVGGGSGNTASGALATVGGGNSNTASGSESTVGGGFLNIASGFISTVGGGNSNTASGDQSTVPGGSQNTAAGDFSFAAGRRAKANHQGSFVWADSTAADFASTANDQFLIRAAGGVGITGNLTVSGMFSASSSISLVGLRTEANATSPNVVGGFSGNTVTAGVVGATIGGGGETTNLNRVTDNGGTVGGGRGNQAGDNAGTTTDRRFATVGGGNFNTASGITATVGGGNSNTASGDQSTVPGGESNVAQGNFSLAAGRRAKANHQGSFVWADSTAADFASTANNQFLIRASGGVGIGTTSPSTSLHVARNSSDIADPVAILESAGTHIPLAFRSGATESARIRADSLGNLVFATLEGTSKNIFFRAGDDISTDIFIQSSTGRVGIGTTSPDQLLTVNGGASKPGGGSWSVFSDERLKTLKGSYSAGLEAVMKLEPIRYEYRADNELGIRTGGEEIGFAAQAVERVIPEAVTRNAQGYLLVNNDPIMWAMLNAIKELKSENDSLKQRLDEMSKQKEEINKQQDQIEKLKKIICLSHPDVEGCK